MGTPWKDHSLRWMRPPGRSDSPLRGDGPPRGAWYYSRNARSPRNLRWRRRFARFSAPRARRGPIVLPGVRLPTILRSLVHLRAFPPAGLGARMIVWLALALLVVLSPAAGAAEDTVTLNFVNADIDAV